MIKSILFDFDGVIAESVDVKTEAFRELFKDYPEHLESITSFHLANGGISRYHKFRHIYKNILKEDLSEDKFKELCVRFSELVLEKVIIAPFVEGVKELLDNCLGRYKMFVISGTPENEIKEIVRRRGLEKYFADILGAPAGKPDLIRKVLENNHYDPGEVIFVGDSINDFNAARQTGVRFIARVVSDNSGWLKSQEVANFKDMKGVFQYLEKFS